ncbi:hypothetical protein NPIL_491901 [Nephila pilipes]|uniref:Uncharacterized protein n=1 Tax=Nephila pilipes TaxID=299642 RepID=A0A8X6TE43_NEPPI|nr:hypothetical protein NPIL_491901 [Nephila pilipes]
MCISISRLEVIACNIGARLANEVSKDLRKDMGTCWSDFMDVCIGLTKKALDRLFPLECTIGTGIPNQNTGVGRSADDFSFNVNPGSENLLQSR